MEISAPLVKVKNIPPFLVTLVTKRRRSAITLVLQSACPNRLIPAKAHIITPHHERFSLWGRHIGEFSNQEFLYISFTERASFTEITALTN